MPPTHKLDNVLYEPPLFFTLVLLLSHPRPRYPLSLFRTLLLTFVIFFLNNALRPIHIHIPSLPLIIPRGKAQRFCKKPSHNMFCVLIQTIKTEALALAQHSCIGSRTGRWLFDWCIRWPDRRTECWQLSWCICWPDSRIKRW